MIVVPPDPKPKVIPIIINIGGNTNPNPDKALYPTQFPINAVSTNI